MIDLKIEQTETKGYALDPYAFKLVYDCGYKKEFAETCLREIQQAQIVVSNLTKRIREITEIYPDNEVWNKKDFVMELHKILRSTMV